MEHTKKVDLGEYIINITYDDVSGSLSVSVLDELEDEIERIDVVNDDEDDNDPFNGLMS